MGAVVGGEGYIMGAVVGGEGLTLTLNLEDVKTHDWTLLARLVDKCNQLYLQVIMASVVGGGGIKHENYRTCSQRFTEACCV